MSETIIFGLDINNIRFPMKSLVSTDSPFTATNSNSTILCNCTSGAITVNLPSAVGISGRVYNIKKTDNSANAVTIDPAGSETVDGAATITVAFLNECYNIQSDGSNWIVI